MPATKTEHWHCSSVTRVPNVVTQRWAHYASVPSQCFLLAIANRPPCSRPWHVKQYWRCWMLTFQSSSARPSYVHTCTHTHASRSYTARESVSTRLPISGQVAVAESHESHGQDPVEDAHGACFCHIKSAQDRLRTKRVERQKATALAICRTCRTAHVLVPNRFAQDCHDNMLSGLGRPSWSVDSCGTSFCLTFLEMMASCKWTSCLLLRETCTVHRLVQRDVERKFHGTGREEENDHFQSGPINVKPWLIPVPRPTVPGAWCVVTFNALCIICWYCHMGAVLYLLLLNYQALINVSFFLSVLHVPLHCHIGIVANK